MLMKVMYKQDAVLFFLLKSKWAEMEIGSKVRNVLFYQSRKLEFKPLIDGWVGEWIYNGWMGG